MTDAQPVTRQTPKVAVVAAIWLALVAAAVSASADAPALQASTDALIALHAERFAAHAGLCAVDLRSGKVLLKHNQDALLLPASHQPLLTSAAAVARLGIKFRYVTGVYRAGEDLLIAGTGDPLLGDPLLAERGKRNIYAELDKWSAAVRKALPDGVKGDLLLLQRRPT